MPALLRHTDCPACGRRHNFFTAESRIRKGSPYEFVCPETGRVAEFSAENDAEEVKWPPQGSVPLTQQKAQPAGV
ncbi:hypothetical protein [Fimbriiglobus ruber]|uniref:Uncharacterized protein n=1 Tax=Fimbriiglobus ruber TaxID=1908690 RepID=A0A225DPQ3_9BACT|nr:hypothetical protein [Fimbriiglobus ruber]OWK40578.1 hypothetical protein FRUB_05497 [Fimbriiglobus ruber]